jgi:N-acetylneuraminic acid mutarotase
MNRLFLVLVVAAPLGAAEPEYAPLPKPVTSFGAAVADGFVYVYGGHSGKPHHYSTETTLGQFLRLNLANPAKWEELPDGPTVQGLALVANGGKIYRIGGMQPKNKPADKAEVLVSLSSVACFDPKSQKWEELPDMPDGRSSHDAVVLDDKIYVAGGWKMNGADKGTTWHKTALVLDLKKQPLKWESFDQPFVRRALTMAACNGKIYVIAGLNEDGDLERTVNIYDPQKKVWSTAAKLPGETMNGFAPAACVCDGKLYVNPSDGKVYRLSEKETWTEVAMAKQPRFVHRIVPIGKNLILSLGGSAKGELVGLTEAIRLDK